MAIVRSPIPESYYYSGQGRLLMGERDPNTGRPIRLYQVGNVPALEIQLAVTSTQHKESMSGQRSTDLTLVTEKTPTINITLESLNLRNLAAAYWGEASEEAAGSVTGEVAKLTRGAAIPLAHPGVTDLVITYDDSGTPATLAETGNYDYDPDYGTIYVLADATDVPENTGLDVTIAYSYAAHSRLDALTASAAPERFLRFEGLNTLNGDAVLVEIPRASFQPAQARALINEEVGQAEIVCDILLDPKITTGSKFFTERILKANYATTTP